MIESTYNATVYLTECVAAPARYSIAVRYRVSNWSIRLWCRWLQTVWPVYKSADKDSSGEFLDPSEEVGSDGEKDSPKSHTTDNETKDEAKTLPMREQFDADFAALAGFFDD